jgi:cation-transporting ATPase E
MPVAERAEACVVPIGGGAVPEACSQPSTGATVALLVVAFWILVVLARPFRVWKAALIAAMALLAVLAFAVPFARDFFDFSLPAGLAWQSLLVGAVGAACVELVYRVAHSGRRAAAEAIAAERAASMSRAPVSRSGRCRWPAVLRGA